MPATLLSPYPYFGGKRKVAAQVWQRLGPVANYVEPFFGSGAVLLGRPDAPGIETINDLNGYISNFWRAVQADPEAVARHADWPVVENDLEARHAWLVAQNDRLGEALQDPCWHDAKIAGWWVWGACAWIGAGWCDGNGPWTMQDGKLAKGNAGRGIKRKLPHVGGGGRGINRKLPHLGDAGQILDYFQALQARLRRVRVACGDWTRVTGDSVIRANGITGIFLDPPYSAGTGRDMTLYAHESADVAHDVREWAIAHGDDPALRIALCGYGGEHDMPAGWAEYAWNAGKGYAAQNKKTGNANGKRERIWFSPHCLGGRQASMFEDAA